jgi:hypothetical protein
MFKPRCAGGAEKAYFSGAVAALNVPESAFRESWCLILSGFNSPPLAANDLTGFGFDTSRLATGFVIFQNLLRGRKFFIIIVDGGATNA